MNKNIHSFIALLIFLSFFISLQSCSNVNEKEPATADTASSMQGTPMPDTNVNNSPSARMADTANAEDTGDGRNTQPVPPKK